MPVTLFGYFVTLDWMTHHPELHSSINPQLVPIQKHYNIYTNILLIIIAEWILCMLFPFLGLVLPDNTPALFCNNCEQKQSMLKEKYHFPDFTFGQAQMGALIVGLNLGFD